MGSLNQKADYLNKPSPTYEWQLHSSLFRLIENIFGPHIVDQFASMTTTQLPNYNSHFYDPHMSGVDAIAQCNWANYNNFVNCPFRMIQKVLQVIQNEKAETTHGCQGNNGAKH